MSWFSNGFRAVGGWVEDRVERIGDWIGDQVHSVWNWASNNVSGLPLQFFSQMGSWFDGAAMLGTVYFKPRHADSDVNALMSGSKWDSGAITYAMPDSRWDYELVNPSATGFKHLSASTEAAVGSIMSSLGSLVVNPVSYVGRGGADIQIAAFEPGSVIQRSHGYYPGVPVYRGDTWIETGHRDVGLKGSRNYFMAMHEIGHSLGLKHPHDSAPGLPKMSSFRDTTEFTVMSYNDTTDRPQSFMQYDVAALQYMYGADFGTNATNTVYRWSPTTGEMFINGVAQGRTNENKIFLTIWDGGGTDTYDFSQFTSNASIDLAAGGTSKVSDSQLANGINGKKVGGNVYNAFLYQGDARSLIENANGGSGSDKISGNDVRNELRGNDGNDELFGRGGNDVLIGGNGEDNLEGGAGSDTLDGGAGYDFASYFHASSGVTASLADQAKNRGEASGDRYMSIEALGGSQYGDTLLGDWNGNNLYGHNGNDDLRGAGGRDWMVGGAGHDLLVGEAGSDWLTGNIGEDLFRFGGALGSDNIDEVMDFTRGQDRLQLDRATFRAFANEGLVLDKHVANGRSATTADHRLVYDAATGAVSYDADGTGAAGQVQFATLVNKPSALRASDFALIWA